MSETQVAITDKNELTHIFKQLQMFDLRLYAISYLTLRTYEEPQVLYSLRVKDIAPKKEYTSTYGNTLIFTEPFRKVLFLLADGKDMDDLIFMGKTAAKAIPTASYTARMFFAFKKKTGISVSLRNFQRTFLYDYFITKAEIPSYTPERYRTHVPYLLERLNITREEYDNIISGNTKPSIFSGIFEESTYTPSNKSFDVIKRIDAIKRFHEKTLLNTKEQLETFSDKELQLMYSTLEELEQTSKEMKELCDNLYKQYNI